MKADPLVTRIIAALRRSQRICLVGHVRPDGDCIGSQLALALALRDLGKPVACWNEDAVPGKLAFLDPDGLLTRPQPGRAFDCVVAADAASWERLGQAGSCLQDRRLLINIDHHDSNTRYGDLNWVCHEVPSTGELIYHLLRAARWPISPAIADCLFTAISTDTGSFQYPSTRPDTFAVAGDLVKRGANLAKICQAVYHSQPLPRVRLVQLIYNRFRLVHQNRTAYFWLKRADLKRAGATADETEGLIDHIRSIEPVVVACLLEEMAPDLVRISLRSKSPHVNVNALAAQFGGGGHAAAAGARIQGSPASVQRRLLRAVKDALEAAT